jgi:hypothetical protein
MLIALFHAAPARLAMLVAARALVQMAVQRLAVAPQLAAVRRLVVAEQLAALGLLGVADGTACKLVRRLAAPLSAPCYLLAACRHAPWGLWGVISDTRRSTGSVALCGALQVDA